MIGCSLTNFSETGSPGKENKVLKDVYERVALSRGERGW
jgi:hypothetical protein